MSDLDELREAVADVLADYRNEIGHVTSITRLYIADAALRIGLSNYDARNDGSTPSPNDQWIAEAMYPDDAASGPPSIDGSVS